jgi:ribosome-associated toxin RatA of RatAB toxin-antitoxin module
MDEKEDQPPADEDEYVPSVREEEPSDETNEMYNLSADEAAADEMETFLASLEKSDTGAELRKELKAKLEVASTKLADLFKKQQLLNEEEERAAQEAIEKELQQAQKEMPVQTQAEEKTAKKQDTLKYIMLQKKANSLMNDVELAEQKSRSVTLQW